MQKVIRRAFLAEKQVARRTKLRAEKKAHLKESQDRREGRSIRQYDIKDIKDARHAQRENYALGPLAPRRDVGVNKETYGAIQINQLRGPELSLEQRVKLDPLSGRRSSLAVNDRVVLLEGRDKGKIGKIIEIDIKRHQCQVEGLNMVDIQVPSSLQSLEDSTPTRAFEKPIYLHLVRLVFPLPDPETGVMRDVIVKNLVSGPTWRDSVTGKRRWNRYVDDSDIKIPWPEKAEPTYEAFECDTRRNTVEDITYTPRLMESPFPSTILDELRNRYSVFRTRHEPEYVARKVQEDKDAENKKALAKSMRSPMKEIARLRRRMRKQAGKPRISPELKQRIAEIIEKKQAVAAEMLEKRKVLLEKTGRLGPLVPMHMRSRRRAATVSSPVCSKAEKLPTPA